MKSPYYVRGPEGRIECVSAADAHRTALALPLGATYRGDLMLGQYVGGTKVWPLGLDTVGAFVPAYAFEALAQVGGAS